MKKLIELDSVLDVLDKIDCSDGVGLSTLKCDVVDDAVATIKALPTVDAVPVVRCRDCEYLDTIPRSTVAPLHHQCKETRLMTAGIWYCPLGKRKDGGGNG